MGSLYAKPSQAKPSQPSQPTNQRWACVPELSQVSDLLSGLRRVESNRTEWRVEREQPHRRHGAPVLPGVRPLAKPDLPDPFRRSQLTVARSPSLSRHTPSGIVSKRGHKRVPISSSCSAAGPPSPGRAPRHTLLPFSISRFLSTIRPVRINRTQSRERERAHKTQYRLFICEHFIENSMNLLARNQFNDLGILLLDLDFFKFDKRVQCTKEINRLKGIGAFLEGTSLEMNRNESRFKAVMINER